ncbi:hypothetical protein MMON_38350 [Mycolicibacterium monacense]|uniref:Uncharacterized protein n=1 Tax=Mycolicibacterium monacense TaxID=85693 RepID=A0AAD1IXS8_MYCMB|nr:hypothetical protein MMON_38350 [Mycolicibacterium monacense]
MPDLPALDLDADDAGALDGDDEVDLVILEVVGDALPRHDEVVGLELVDQCLVGAALGAFETRVLIGRDRHETGLPCPNLSGMPTSPIPAVPLWMVARECYEKPAMARMRVP